MKLQIWDILSIVFLVLAVVVIGIVTSIFADPNSGLNPFPPATLPARLMLPTSTPTPRRLPATWTPVGGSGNGSSQPKAVSATPQPSPTGFILPTSTNTPTDTPTVTVTRTVTKTPTNTPQPTANLQATNNYLQTQIYGGLTATSAIKTVQSLQTQTAASKTP